MADEFPDPDERAMLRLIHAAGRSKPAPHELPGEETLWAYVSGAADEDQIAQVHAAIAADPAVRRELLSLMTTMNLEATDAEETAFASATPPPLGHDARLRRIHASLKKPPGGGVSNHGVSRTWIQWLVGGWATVATAACAFLLVIALPRIRSEVPSSIENPPPPVTSPTPRPYVPPAIGNLPSHLSVPSNPGPTPHPAPTPAFGLEIARVTGLQGSMRGEGEPRWPTPTIRVGADTRSIELMAAPPAVDEGEVRVWVVSPSGKVIVDETRPVQELFGRPILRIRSSAPFQAGRYVLRITGKRGTETEEAVYPFVLTGD